MRFSDLLEKVKKQETAVNELLKESILAYDQQDFKKVVIEAFSVV